MSEEGCRIYLVSPPKFEPEAFRDQLVAAIDAGNVGALQIRLKDATDDEIKRSVEILLPVTDAQGICLILNDRPDLAAETGCDGVHIGQDDMPFAEARAMIGDDKIVGVTCHDSRHLAIVAGEQGADYVAFGAFHPSITKDASTQATPEIIEWWSGLMVIPSVAIGGITAQNCAPIVQAGADFIAAISAIWDWPDGPAAGIRALDAAINSALHGESAAVSS